MKSILITVIFLAIIFSAQAGGSKCISTSAALKEYEGKTRGQSFLLFPEVREKSVQWFDSLRVDWLEYDAARTRFELNAQPGEYFSYQLVVWALENLSNLEVKFSDLKSDDGRSIPIQAMTCFNTGGINFQGTPFTKKVQVNKGRVQSLWIGIDLENVAPGIYSGNASVICEGSSKKMLVTLKVSGQKVADHGYDEGKRMSRLNWLNSTVGLEDKVTKPFIELERSGNTIRLLGRQFTIGNDGLPSSIITYFTPSVQSVGGAGENIIGKAFNFIIEKNDGQIIKLKPGKIKFEKESHSAVEWVVMNVSPEVELECRGTMEFDGFVDYRLTLKSLKPIAVKDIRLEIPMAKEKAVYMMGLNSEGGYRPAGIYNWTWDTIRNQDMLWLGAVNGGIRIKWKAENYIRPLVNIYYSYGPLHLPPSWANKGAGGVRVYEEGNEVLVNAFSGNRAMKKGDELHYDFELLITPFKTIDKNVQYNDRYLHPILGTSTKDMVQTAKDKGANIITIHHGCDIYPFINYPYVDEFIPDFKALINDAHQNNMRMKFYYTTRELTKNIPEFWAFWSLNGEITFPGVGNNYVSTYGGGGSPEWFKKNLKENYIPAWCQVIDKGIFKGETDISVITTPDSRLNNFYLGGLEWMVKNMGLDGIYIDDAASDRVTLRRARSIIDQYRPEGRIDIHSWNIYCKAAGFGNCLNVYMDLLPYIDLTWIGEDRDYSRMPDHWLIEQSGIPYGLPGQMIGEGNPWKGMVFGESNRLGWGGNPEALWKFWDQYSIKEKDMIGYWDQENNPVRVNNDLVKATCYKGNKESIIAVAVWGNSGQTCDISLDREKLGYDEKGCSIFIPGIDDFQQEQVLTSLQSIKIPENKGFLIVLKKK